MSNRLVCICNFIEEKEIIKLLKQGAGSARDIQQLTRAGTTCGRCLPVIDDLVESNVKEKPKEQQRKLNFGF